MPVIILAMNLFFNLEVEDLISVLRVIRVLFAPNVLDSMRTILSFTLPLARINA